MLGIYDGEIEPQPNERKLNDLLSASINELDHSVRIEYQKVYKKTGDHG